MLRSGSAFTEILLLGRNLDELAGYTFRWGSEQDCGLPNGPPTLSTSINRTHPVSTQ
jgi:hypothetical protein